jgi:hypothetical protein
MGPSEPPERSSVQSVRHRRLFLQGHIRRSGVQAGDSRVILGLDLRRSGR